MSKYLEENIKLEMRGNLDPPFNNNQNVKYNLVSPVLTKQ
jgi:hypothetical protein